MALPKMEGFIPNSPLQEESLKSFDQMRRQFGGTDDDLLDFVGRDTEIESEGKKEDSPREKK